MCVHELMEMRIYLLIVRCVYGTIVAGGQSLFLLCIIFVYFAMFVCLPSRLCMILYVFYFLFRRALRFPCDLILRIIRAIHNNNNNKYVRASRRK